MKKHLMLAATLISFTSSAYAALSPLYESIKELNAILEDPQLTTELTSGEAIESIEKNESGYELRTNRSHIQIIVHYKPQEMPGPVPFELQFHKAETKAETESESE